MTMLLVRGPLRKGLNPEVEPEFCGMRPHFSFPITESPPPEPKAEQRSRHGPYGGSPSQMTGRVAPIVIARSAARRLCERRLRPYSDMQQGLNDFFCNRRNRQPLTINDDGRRLMQHQIVRSERIGLDADVGAVKDDRFSSPHRAALPAGATVRFGPIDAGNDDLAPIDPLHVGGEDGEGRRVTLLAFLRQPDLVPGGPQLRRQCRIEIALGVREQRARHVDLRHAAILSNTDTHSTAAPPLKIQRKYSGGGAPAQYNLGCSGVT